LGSAATEIQAVGQLIRQGVLLLAPEDEGKFEEIPPNIVDSLLNRRRHIPGNELTYESLKKRYDYVTSEVATLEEACQALTRAIAALRSLLDKRLSFCLVTLPDIGSAADRVGWPLEDRWIVSRTLATAAEVNKLLGDFQLNEAGRVLYDFLWSEYCDWYLEMAKVRLKDGDKSPLPVLAYVLQASLRLLHPIMPFVTEIIWQHLRDRVDGLEEALIIAAYPLGEGEIDIEAEVLMRPTLDVIKAIRNLRTSHGIEPKKSVSAITFVPLDKLNRAFLDLALELKGRDTELYSKISSDVQRATQAFVAETIPDLTSAISQAAPVQRLAWASDSLKAIRNSLEKIPSADFEESVAAASLSDQFKQLRNALDHSLNLSESLKQTHRIVETLSKAKVDSETQDSSLESMGERSVIAIDGGEVVLALAGLIDLDAERDRTTKELQQAQSQVDRLSQKLAKAEFRSKAPANVVARQEEMLASARSRLAALEQRLDELA
jgi:valyl-tRNA synthetase